MSKRLIVTLAAALVVGIAFGAAYAEVQNVKVSGDLNVIGVARQNLTLGQNIITTADYGKRVRGVLSQTRVRVDADLTDNVMTTVRLLNERLWGTSEGANTNSADVVVDLAFVTLKEFLYAPLTLTVGRQELKFGNLLVVGSSGAGASGHASGTAVIPKSIDDMSIRKAFDGIRATLNYDPLIVDVVYANIANTIDQDSDDSALYGVNASYALNQNVDLEAYIWQRARHQSSTAATSLGFTSDHERLNTTGVKGVYKGIENLVLGLESAFQFGDHQSNTTFYPNEGSNDKRNRKVTAYAIQATANYAMPQKKYTPTLGGSYTYLSGNKYQVAGTNPIDDTYRGWDPMFEDQGGGTLWNRILGFSNCQLFNLNGSMKPREDVTLSVNYYYIMLNEKFTNAAGAVVMSGIPGDPAFAMKGGKKDLAQEIDLGVLYDYTEDVQFGLNCGAFLPGDAFAMTNQEVASQVVGSMKVTF